jgi:uncharacterized protein YceH (UPF0502 family)
MDALSPEEIRVLGSLIEKSLTTPDNYPLTQNALIAACNQLSNRNPVVSYDDNTVRLTLNGLRTRSLARIIHIPGSRAPKHRHVLDEALELDRNELSLLCVLMLRGAQTTGELRARTERMTQFASLSEVEETLERLADRPEPLVLRLERAPGQKESRWVHLLGGEPDSAALAEYAAASWSDGDREPAAPRPAAAPREDRVAALEARVTALEAALAELRRDLGHEPGPSDPGGYPLEP